MAFFRAWLHDISVADWGVNTYWITSGKGVRAFYPLTAEWFLTKTDQETCKQILSHPEVESIEEVSKYKSIHEWKSSPVLRIKVNPAKLRDTFEDLRKYWGDYLFNADLSLFQQFCFQTGLFPYVYAKIEVQNGRLQDNWQLLEQYLQSIDQFLSRRFGCNLCLLIGISHVVRSKRFTFVIHWNRTKNL